MSFRAVTWAFDTVRGLGATQKLVLLALAEFANDEDVTWRSQKAIAERAECSERSVKRHLVELEKRGLIQRKTRYAWCDDPRCGLAGQAGHKHRCGTLYWLNLSWRPERVSAGQPIGANLAPMEETAVFSGNTDSVENEGEGARVERMSSGAKSGSPQVPPVAPIRINKPPINNPHTLPAQVENARERENALSAGKGGAGASLSTREGARPLDAGIASADALDDGAGALVGADCVIGGDELSPPPANKPVKGSVSETGTQTAPDPIPSRGECLKRAQNGSGAVSRLSDSDWRLIEACVPAALRNFDPAGAVAVHAALQKRVAAGWRPESIRELLGQGRLPGRVLRASSLVLSRLQRNVPVDGAPVARGARRAEVVDVPVEDLGAYERFKQAFPQLEGAALVRRVLEAKRAGESFGLS